MSCQSVFLETQQACVVIWRVIELSHYFTFTLFDFVALSLLAQTAKQP